MVSEVWKWCGNSRCGPTMLLHLIPGLVLRPISPYSIAASLKYLQIVFQSCGVSWKSAENSQQSSPRFLNIHHFIPFLPDCVSAKTRIFWHTDLFNLAGGLLWNWPCVLHSLNDPNLSCSVCCFHTSAGTIFTWGDLVSNGSWVQTLILWVLFLEMIHHSNSSKMPIIAGVGWCMNSSLYGHRKNPLIFWCYTGYTSNIMYWTHRFLTLTDHRWSLLTTPPKQKTPLPFRFRGRNSRQPEKLPLLLGGIPGIALCG